VGTIVDRMGFCTVTVMNDINSWELHQVLRVIPFKEVMPTRLHSLVYALEKPQRAQILRLDFYKPPS
jgi:hypothetical protein